MLPSLAWQILEHVERTLLYLGEPWPLPGHQVIELSWRSRSVKVQLFYVIKSAVDACKTKVNWAERLHYLRVFAMMESRGSACVHSSVQRPPSC
jgi:hypothetical protein